MVSGACCAGAYPAEGPLGAAACPLVFDELAQPATKRTRHMNAQSFFPKSAPFIPFKRDRGVDLTARSDGTRVTLQKHGATPVE